MFVVCLFWTTLSGISKAYLNLNVRSFTEDKWIQLEDAETQPCCNDAFTFTPVAGEEEYKLFVANGSHDGLFFMHHLAAY